MPRDPRTPAEVFPPGDFLSEELQERGWSVPDLAAELSHHGFGFISVASYLREVIAGTESVTPNLAAGLSEVFGTSADFWLNLERMYQEWHVARPPASERGQVVEEER